MERQGIHLHLVKLWCLVLHWCRHRVKLPRHVLGDWGHWVRLSRYILRYWRHWHGFTWNVDWWFRHGIRLSGSEFLLVSHWCCYTLDSWFNWLAGRLGNFWFRRLFVDLIALILLADHLHFIPLVINRRLHNSTLHFGLLLRLLRFLFGCNDRRVADFWLNDDRVCFLNFAAAR